MNYLLAFMLFSGVLFFAGEPAPSNQPVIGEIAAGFPAEQAGIKEGDRILSVDGIKVGTWVEMSDAIHKFPDKKIIIEYEAKGEKHSALITTVSDPSGKTGLIGIRPSVEYIKIGLVNSAKGGIFQCYFWTKFTIVSLASKIYKKEKPDLAGPVGIVTMVSKAAHSGMPDFFFLVALISVAVGFFNLLPIPLLDGGHALMYIGEGIFRRKITMKVMKVTNSVGLAILGFILIFATYSDIMRIHSSRKKVDGKQETVELKTVDGRRETVEGKIENEKDKRKTEDGSREEVNEKKEMSDLSRGK